MAPSQTTFSEADLRNNESPTDSLPFFRYEPLAPGEIRLLTPTDDESGLSWTLQVAKLDDETLAFEALSYVWGSQDSTFAITCNNQRHYVHRGLYIALPYLARRHTYKRPTESSAAFLSEGRNDSQLLERSPVAEDYSADEEPLLPIWIDALCIDQTNEEEKMVQVAAMNTVYRRARVVWIWLGVGAQPDYLQDAIDHLPVWIHAGIRTEQHQKGLGILDEEDLVYINQQFDETNDGELLWFTMLANMDLRTTTTLEHLLCNEWFRRVWILQEFILAQASVFLAGEHTIPTRLLRMATKYSGFTCKLAEPHQGNLTGLLPLSLAFCSYVVFSMRDMMQPQLSCIQATSRISSIRQYTAAILLELSIRASVFQHCSSPRDRIVGILGILSLEQYLSLDTDLHAIKDTSELYVTFSAILLVQIAKFSQAQPYFAGWNYLGMACQSKCSSDLPSWVPNLHVSSMPWQRAQDFGYSSSRRESVMNEGRRKEELVVRGRAVHVVATSCPGTPSLGIQRYFSRASCSMDECIGLYQLAVWEEEARNAFIRVCGVDLGEGETHLLPKQFWQTLLVARNLVENEVTVQVNYGAFHRTLQQLRFCGERCVWTPDLKLPPQQLRSKSDMHSASSEESDASSEMIIGDRDISGAYVSVERDDGAEVNVSIDLALNEGRVSESSHWWQEMIMTTQRLRDETTAEGQFIKQMEHLPRHGQYMFFTTNGGVGLADQKLLEGDIVCVFNGAPMSHILRKAGDQETGAYRLVDEVYVHGLMDGEVDTMDIQDQDFVLV